MRENILQQFIDSSGEYLIGQKDDRCAVFLSPNIDRELRGKQIVDLPYGVVRDFANTEILTTINLDGMHPPFQYGIRYKDFISLHKVTCNENALIHRCYQEKITDYYDILEIMKDITEYEKSQNHYQSKIIK